MSKKEKKPSRLARLEAYADGRHHFIAAANLMSAVSSVIGVVPFYFLWKIADDTLEGRTGGLFADMVRIQSGTADWSL